MNKVKAKLLEAMAKKGVEQTVMEEIVNSIDSFALYGFPESHAISFALLACASAYLKCHRSMEFFASLLNNQPIGFYSPATLIQDARWHGIRTLPVCVVRSDWNCLVEDDQTVRLGMRCVRSTGGLS